MEYQGLRFTPAVMRALEGADGTPPTRAMIQRRVDQLNSEFKALRPHLLDEIATLLDIGCGLGAMSVLIARHRATKVLHLMDGRGEPKNRRMGFHDGTRAWFDVRIGVDFAAANLRHQDTDIIGVVADPDRTIPSRMIVSFKSWGAHYPVETYLPLVRRSLLEGGRIILDIRKGTGGETALRGAGFKMVAELGETDKLTRVVMER